MHNVFTWPINHPVVFPLILFVLSGVVSIYGPDIKRFIHKGPVKFWQYNQRLFANDLSLIKWLHNNPYNLSLYFYSEIVGAITTFLAWYTGLLIFNWLIHGDPTPMSYIIFGITVGTAIRMRRIFKLLFDYENSVRELSKHMGISSQASSAQAGS